MTNQDIANGVLAEHRQIRLQGSYKPIPPRETVSSSVATFGMLVSMTIEPLTVYITSDVKTNSMYFDPDSEMLLKLRSQRIGLAVMRSGLGMLRGRLPRGCGSKTTPAGG
jgi:hypothetical protein